MCEFCETCGQELPGPDWETDDEPEVDDTGTGPPDLAALEQAVIASIDLDTRNAFFGLLGDPDAQS